MKRMLFIVVATACVASVGTLAEQDQPRRPQASATELDAVLFVNWPATVRTSDVIG